MPSYSSKSQKRSQSQSKSGGRRRKRTMRKYRRGKKVMRGGAEIPQETLEKIKNYLTSDGGASVLAELSMETANVYNDNFETNFTTKYSNLSSAAKLKLKTMTGYYSV